MNDKEMYEVGYIYINEFDKLRQFQNLIINYGTSFILKNDIYVANAKSVMGIFSLDLSQPLKLCSSVPNNEDLIMKLKEIGIFVED